MSYSLGCLFALAGKRAAPPAPGFQPFPQLSPAAAAGGGGGGGLQAKGGWKKQPPSVVAYTREGRL